MELQEFKDRFIEVIPTHTIHDQYRKEYNCFDSNKFEKYIEESLGHPSGRYLIQGAYHYYGLCAPMLRTNDKDEFKHLLEMTKKCGCLHELGPDYYVYYDLEDNSDGEIKYE